MELRIMELKPIFDARASFYGKATIEIKEDCITYNEVLKSYGTTVAIYTKDKITPLKQYTYFGKYSQTTTRHQKEFFKQKGLNDDEIKQLFNSFNGEVAVYEKN